MMLSFLSGLKTKLALLLGAALGFMILYSNHLKSGIRKRELDRVKSASNYKDRANEALNRGLENEANRKTTKRGYFDDNSGN